MASTIQVNPAHETLLGVIRRVRARWRLKLALRGAAIVLGALVMALIVGAYVMQSARFAPEAITGVRIASYVVIAVLLVRYVLRPLMRRATDEHVALYLEEHEPSLDAAVLSAVEHGRSSEDSADRSPLLARRLVENALERTHAVGDGTRVDQPAILRAAMFAGGAALLGLIALGIGPTFLRDGARLLLAPWRSAEAAQPYAIAVMPGNITIAKGGDQEVSATLRGFSAEGVELAVRRGSATAWEHIPMSARGDSAHFSIRLFDIAERTEYYVESNGVRSGLFRIDVANLPYVKKIDLEFRYPAYTGMANETVPDGGDIAAPRGTTVIVHAMTTMAVKGGRIVMEGKPSVPLTLGADGTLTGPIQVTANGFYKLELQTQAGDFIPGSLDYTIDVLDDRPPTIKFEKPGRDTKVTAVDEVFTQVQATDDYGVSDVDLMYSVNGGPEQKVALAAGGKALREVVAGHTFFLEELHLKPGDLISYYARAKDNGGSGQEAKTDIYFMSVRPFDQTYKQSEQAGGGGGGGAEDPGELTERQRQVVAGTFNVERDRKTTPPTRLRENYATLNLAQGRVREAVETLMKKIMERNITALDTAFKIIAEELPLASKEMQAAEEQLLKSNSTDALPPEQRALQHLQRAEAAFKEYQIQRGQGGGGGGGQQSKAEDLADLFELDADKLRNQYETVERGSQQQQADNKVDETAEKLKQLASRLQQENERLKNGMRGQPGQQSGGGGGSQRQLADEAEQMARQLERLAHENPQNANNDQLEESARRLQEAANAMRRSASGANDGGVSQGASALDRLQEARRLLDENRNGRTARDLDDAVRKAEKIANSQRDISNDVDKLGKGSANGSVDAGEANKLIERKQGMEGDVRQLESQLDRMARDSRKDHAEASKMLDSAVSGMRETRLADRVQASQRIAQALAQGRTSPDYAKQFENTISSAVDEMKQKVNAAASAAKGQGDNQAAGKSLDRARDLVRSQESLAERVRQRRLGEGNDQGDSSAVGRGARGAQGNQPGQNGQQSQQNAQGGRQNGQQGANGQQQGQSGQQGANGQQQGQSGQQGQQGQGQNGQQSQSGQQGQGQSRAQQGQSGQQGQGQGQGQGQQGQNGQQQGGGQMGGGQNDQQGPGGQLGGNNQRGGGVPNGRLSADDIRQFAREFRDQRQSAEQLRKDLQQMGVDPSDLNRMIDQMRQLENGKAYNDPAAIEKLQQSLIEGLKAFEFALRRQVEGNDKGRPVLGASGEVPAGFRQMVDEYYRSLSKKPQK
jgi:hypothetical protein